MTEITANIDGASIQEAMAKAVLESSVGEHIKKAIEKILKETYSTRSIVQTAVESAVRDLVENEAIHLISERAEAVRDRVRESITDAVVESAIQAMLAKVLNTTY